MITKPNEMHFQDELIDARVLRQHQIDDAVQDHHRRLNEIEDRHDDLGGTVGALHTKAQIIKGHKQTMPFGWTIHCMRAPNQTTFSPPVPPARILAAAAVIAFASAAAPYSC